MAVKSLQQLRDELLAEDLGELAPAQENARRLNSQAAWGEIGSGLAGAISGGAYKPDNSAFQQLRREGQQGIDQATQRLALGKSAMGEAKQLQADQVAAQQRAEENDPNSASSQQLRGLMVQAYPKLEESLKGMSHARLKEVYPILKEMGDDGSFALSFSPAGQGYVTNHKTGAVSPYGAPQPKEAAPVKGIVVPGKEIAPGAEPTPEDAKKVKASQASVKRMRSYVTELRDLYAKNGPSMTGPAALRMKQLGTQIRLEGKNIAELGALSGPDMALMNDLVKADPTSLASNVKGIFGMDNTLGALEGLDRWTGDQEKAVDNAYGYQNPTGAAPAAPTAADQQAVDWAKANPNDPRAAEILRLHGVQ